MKPLIILNPYAGRWNGRERKPDIEAALLAAGLEAKIVETEAPGHATQLAAQAISDGYSPIIGAGGDGTLGEVLNGLMQANQGQEKPVGPLGIIPVGSANDLGDQLGIPRDISQAVAILARGKTRKIDIGQMNERYFLNNAGLGLEPYISILQSNMKRLKGNPRYVAAALQGIMHHPTWKMKLEWEGGQYAGPISLISVANWARTGGVFYTVPHAIPDDGMLSFIHGYIPTRLKTLLAMPMTMKPEKGNITEHPAVIEANTRWLKVTSETPTPAHTDGEIVTRGIQEIEFRILPGKLEVIVP